MKRLVTPVTPVVLLVGLILGGSVDKGISVADTNISDDEVVANMTKSGNPSASATITITMYNWDE